MKADGRLHLLIDRGFHHHAHQAVSQIRLIQGAYTLAHNGITVQVQGPCYGFRQDLGSEQPCHGADVKSPGVNVKIKPAFKITQFHHVQTPVKSVRDPGKPFPVFPAHSNGQHIDVHIPYIAVMIHQGIQGCCQMSGVSVIGCIYDICCILVPIHIMPPVSYILWSF